MACRNAVLETSEPHCCANVAQHDQHDHARIDQDAAPIMVKDDAAFPAGLGKDRIVSSDEVIRRDPEVIVASWCGKRVREEMILSRPGWAEVAAIRNKQVYEIKSALILQPGPAALTDGLNALCRVISRTADVHAGDANL